MNVVAVSLLWVCCGDESWVGKQKRGSQLWASAVRRHEDTEASEPKFQKPAEAVETKWHRRRKWPSRGVEVADLAADMAIARAVGLQPGARAVSVEESLAGWKESERCEAAEPTSEAAGERITVAIAYDGLDPLPPLAVINSTATSAGDRVSWIEIAAVTESDAKAELLALLRAPEVSRLLPSGLRVRVCDGLSSALAERPALSALSAMNESSSRVRRRELLSLFNFAAFYLPHALVRSNRLVYLDTDAIVVRRDWARQASSVFKTLGKGKPVAAVEDCSQRLSKYVNFQLLRKLLAQRTSGPLAYDRFFGPDRAVDEETCVFNRGVVLFDARRWRDLRLTAVIEELVAYYVKSKAKLWRGGVSQPPFLVALAGRYKKLPLEWNVRGVGRVDLSHVELERTAAMIRDKRPASNASYTALLAHTSLVGPFQKRTPFVAPLAYRAHVLHFTGEIKPWRVSRTAALDWSAFGVATDPQGHVKGECFPRRDVSAVLNATSPTALFATGCFARLPLCACGPRDCVESCAAVWHRYVAPQAWAALESLRALSIYRRHFRINTTSNANVGAGVKRRASKSSPLS